MTGSDRESGHWFGHLGPVSHDHNWVTDETWAREMWSIDFMSGNQGATCLQSDINMMSQTFVCDASQPSVEITQDDYMASKLRTIKIHLIKCLSVIAWSQFNLVSCVQSNASLWLAEADHVIRALASDWSITPSYIIFAGFRPFPAVKLRTLSEQFTDKLCHNKTQSETSHHQEHPDCQHSHHWWSSSLAVIRINSNWPYHQFSA